MRTPVQPAGECTIDKSSGCLAWCIVRKAAFHRISAFSGGTLHTVTLQISQAYVVCVPSQALGFFETLPGFTVSIT